MNGRCLAIPIVACFYLVYKGCNESFWDEFGDRMAEATLSSYSGTGERVAPQPDAVLPEPESHQTPGENPRQLLIQ